MAKKVLKEGELPSVFDMVKSVDSTAEIIAESAYSNISDFIPTGNYILNACMTGDMLHGGVPAGRITTFYGPSSVGKSFLACSCSREAQKKGYTVIYMDSEGSIDSKFVSRLGVDPTKLIIKQVQTISETSQFIANVCAQLEQQQEEYGSHQKVMFVLDSLGNLTSDKEKEDTMSGNNKVDLTKAKDVKAMFRVIATPLAKMQCPMIVNNHSYACLYENTLVLMADGTFKEIKDIQINDYVMTMSGPEKINNKFEYDAKDCYKLEFDDGTVIECTENHKFLVRENNELIYKEAMFLNENDDIISIE